MLSFAPIAGGSELTTGLIALPGEDTPGGGLTAGATDESGLTTFAALLVDDESPPAVELDSRMLAQIIYTSGTESLPKGAMLTHEAVAWEYVSCVVEGEIAETDVMLHALPLYHCAQLDVFLGPGIYVGAVNLITGKPTPENLLELLARHRIGPARSGAVFAMDQLNDLAFFFCAMLAIAGYALFHSLGRSQESMLLGSALLRNGELPTSLSADEETRYRDLLRSLDPISRRKM